MSLSQIEVILIVLGDLLSFPFRQLLVYLGTNPYVRQAIAFVEWPTRTHGSLVRYLAEISPISPYGRIFICQPRQGYVGGRQQFPQNRGLDAFWMHRLNVTVGDEVPEGFYRNYAVSQYGDMRLAPSGSDYSAMTSTGGLGASTRPASVSKLPDSPESGISTSPSEGSSDRLTAIIPSTANRVTDDAHSSRGCSSVLSMVVPPLPPAPPPPPPPPLPPLSPILQTRVSCYDDGSSEVAAIPKRSVHKTSGVKSQSRPPTVLPAHLSAREALLEEIRTFQGRLKHVDRRLINSEKETQKPVDEGSFLCHALKRRFERTYTAVSSPDHDGEESFGNSFDDSFEANT